VFFTKGKMLFKIFWVLFPLILMVCIEAVAFSTMLITQPEVLVLYLALPSMYRIQIAIISKAFQIIVLLFLLKYKLRLERFGGISLAPPIVSAICGISLIFMLVYMLYDGRMHDPTAALVASLAFLAVNLLILWMAAIVDTKSQRILANSLEELEADHREREDKLESIYRELLSDPNNRFKNCKANLEEFESRINERRESWAALREKHKDILHIDFSDPDQDNSL